jgi:hypothetical protein
MKLAGVIEGYLARRRSRGMLFESAGRLMGHFSRTVGDRQIHEVNLKSVDLLNEEGC